MPSLLSLIWMTAVGLVALAFATLAVLIMARLRREQEERDHPNERARISKLIVGFAINGGEAPPITIGNPRQRRLLTEVALDTALIVPGHAQARLVKLLLGIGLDQKLRRAARCGNVRDQMLAIEGLRLFPSKATIAAILRSEQSRDMRIWLAALRVRTQLRAGPSMRDLLKLLDRPGARRSPIMHELVAERALAHPDEALSTLRDTLPTMTRAVLLRAIGDTGGSEALKPLRVACLSVDPAVRSAAVGALGALGFPEAGEALVHATRDVDWRVRLKASEAIGRLGLWRYAEHLEPLLRDRVWWVRFRAEEALRRLRNLSIQEFQQASVRSDSPRQTAPTVAALAQ